MSQAPALPPSDKAEVPADEPAAQTPAAVARPEQASDPLGPDQVGKSEPLRPELPKESMAADDSADPAVESDPAVDPRPLQRPADSASADSPAEEPPMEELDSGRSPAEIAAAKAFAEPEGARRLSPDAQLWIDPKRGRLIVDGYVTLREGPLEMFACPVGTKEHESVVSVLSPARYVHAGLLAIDAKPGTPVSFSPEYRPATGQRIAIWVMWRNAEGEVEKAPAQQWVQLTGTDQALDSDWVFAGSSFWRDPSTGREYYQADSGDLVCVSNFSTAMLDLPVESSQSNAALQYSAFTSRIPPQGTPVRLVFVPIPLPTDEPEAGDETEAEEEPQAAAASRVDPREPPEDALLQAPAQAASE